MTGILNMLLGAANYLSLATTVTAGSNVSAGSGDVGYSSSLSIGSLSATSIGAGTIVLIADQIVASTVVAANLFISIGSNPLQGFIGNVTFNGHTFNGAAASYMYTGGVAQWSWSTSVGWGFVNAGNYPGTVGYE